MRYVVNASEMKQADYNTTEKFGIPAIVLMERAALETARIITERFATGASVFVMCGRGNNGGDGLAIGRMLKRAGYRVTVFLDDKQPYSELCEKQKQICLQHGMRIDNTFVACEYDVIVDALFGIGLSRMLDEKYQRLIDVANNMGGFHIAVDIASGLNADTGKAMPVAFRADMTVTYGFPKVGLYVGEGRKCSGKVVVCEIGIPEEAMEKCPTIRAVYPGDLFLPKRDVMDNKGSRGKLVIIAGSEKLQGTALLVANAAYRVGCGMVKVITHQTVVSNVVTCLPDVMTYGYDENTAEEELLTAMNWGDCIVIGPGIGTDSKAAQLLKLVITKTNLPTVIDADALTILAEDRELYDKLLQCEPGRFILTPHMKEYERISGITLDQMHEVPVESLREYANEVHCTIVRKDARTMIGLTNGEIVLPISGNDVLAKAGAGDVLCGLIGGILAGASRRTEDIEGRITDYAAINGTLLHGILADRAVACRTPQTVMASELCNYL